MSNRHLVIGGQFVRFAIVGTLGFIVDASVLYLCLHGTGLGLYGGRMVSYLVAATTTWYFNRKFTFTTSDSASPMRQWARFVVANGFGGLINYGTYSFVVSYWAAVPLAPLIGVAAGSITGLGVNFTASRLFVFKENLPGAAALKQRPLKVWRLLSIANLQGKQMADKTALRYSTITVSRMATLGLQIAALSLFSLMLLKAIVDVDIHFDTWWYHLPWAARLAGLMPSDAFYFEQLAAVRFEGFPVLAEFLQGLLWRVTGRVESANLVSFASLAAYILFLRHYFGVAWWLSIPALLAVPLIQAQATSTYIDLFANLAMATFVMLTFLMYTRKELINGKFLALMAMAAFIAANSKLQLIPLVALTLIFCVYPVVNWINERRSKLGHSMRLWIFFVALLVALSAIFFVPLKNIALHGNPAYPIKLTVFGTILNYAEELHPEEGAGTLVDQTQAIKWLYSTFELGMGPIFNVQRWTVDSAAPSGAPMTIQGGLFGFYVVFQLLLFLWLLSRVDGRQRKVAAFLVGIVMLAAALMPASHLLRYYMFWFICVISLNLHFLAYYGSTQYRWVFGAIFFAFVLIVIDATDQNFVHTRFHSVQDFLAERADSRILRELAPNSSTCLALAKTNHPFFYASVWYGNTPYSIKEGPTYPSSKAELERSCEGWRVITSP